MILQHTDVIRRAKYPLAIVAKILDKITGKKLIGYDIGCAFGETVLHSRLKTAVEASGSRFCVNAFHGYSHSYDCQVQHHPNVIDGVGLEELETLERVFSASNQLAPVIRYASPYRRLSFIHAFFRQWDSEKYANIGLFLYNNYTQALEITENQGTALEAALGDLGITSQELDKYDIAERQYFTNLRDEDQGNLWTIAYVETLQALSSARYFIPSRYILTTTHYRCHIEKNLSTCLSASEIGRPAGRTEMWISHFSLPGTRQPTITAIFLLPVA